MTGWISDTFRLAWGALYWNTRKTWHLLRGRRGPCPCQVASDSGLAHRTGCEAITHFRSPGLFRVACPLLARRSDGAWVCSVDAPRTRPFWGRAFLLFSLGGLGSYAVVTLLVFLALNALGFRPSYRQVAWPRAWPELRAVQSRRYLEQSREARAAGRPAEALFALSSAYELNPADYASGLLLAQLSQGAQPARSDAVFARLYREHPDRREHTAKIWYRALLARGEMAGIVPLALDRLLASEGEPSSGWIQALLFAGRRAGRPEAFATAVRHPRIPPAARALVELEQSLAEQSPTERIRTLVDAIPAQRESFAAAYLLRRLLEENRPDLVLSLASSGTAPLGDRESVLLRLDALAALGRSSDRLALLRRLVAVPVHPATRELLSAHLILHPDRDLLRIVAQANRRDPLPANENAYPTLLSWFTACAIDGDPELVREASALLSQAAERDLRALERARQAFLADPSTFRLEQVLPLIQPLPLETTYSLYARYAPLRPSSS